MTRPGHLDIFPPGHFSETLGVLPQEVHEKKRDAMVHAREMKSPACSTWSWDDVWSVEQILSAVFSIITHLHVCFDPKIDRSLVRWKDRDQNIIYTLIIIYVL